MFIMSDMVLYKIGMDGEVEEVCRETIQEFTTDEDTPCIIPIPKNLSEEELNFIKIT